MELGHRRGSNSKGCWKAETVGNGGGYLLETRTRRKSAKRLAPKTLVTTGLETLAACSN